MLLKNDSKKSMLEQLSLKTKDPLYICVNCLCSYCANNVEGVWRRVKPKEQKKPCFNCDTCLHYDENKMEYRELENCNDFLLSDYGAQRNRKKLRIVGGKDVHKMSEMR